MFLGIYNHRDVGVNQALPAKFGQIYYICITTRLSKSTFEFSIPSSSHLLTNRIVDLKGSSIYIYSKDQLGHNYKTADQIEMYVHVTNH